MRNFYSALSTRTKALLILCILIPIVLNAVLFALPRNSRQPPVVYTGGWLIGRALDDSWRPMREALNHVESDSNTPLYQAVFVDGQTKFQYPTSSLLLLDALETTGLGWKDSLPPKQAARREVRLLNAISWLFVPAIAILTAVIFLRQQRAQQLTTDPTAQTQPPPPQSNRDRILQFLAIGFLAMTFYPLTRSFGLGQLQTWITFLLTSAALLYMLNKQTLCGLLVGLAVIFKPHLGLILIWALTRKQWKLAAAGLGTAGILTLIAVIQYGWTNSLDYLPVIQHLAKVGETFHANQSLNGLLNRAYHHDGNLTFNAQAFPPYTPFIHITTVITSLLILAAAFWPRPMTTQSQRSLSFALILLAVTTASPIAWEHHYAVLLPVFAILTPIVLHLRTSWLPIALLIAAYTLASQRYSITDYLADTPLNVLQSYLYFAAITLLLLTLWAYKKLAHTQPTHEHRTTATPPQPAPST